MSLQCPIVYIPEPYNKTSSNFSTKQALILMPNFVPLYIAKRSQTNEEIPLLSLELSAASLRINKSS